MRFILTIMWLFGMTWLGYWIGGTYFNGSDIAFAIGFFILAVIIRLLFVRGSGGSSSNSDSGFFAFFGCDGASGGSGGGCSGGSSCGGGD